MKSLIFPLIALLALWPVRAHGEDPYDSVHFDELNRFEIGTFMMIAEDVHEYDAGYQQALASGRNWICIEKLLHEMDGLMERMPAVAKMTAEESAVPEGDDSLLDDEEGDPSEEDSLNPYQRVFPTWRQMLEHDGLSWKEWHEIALIKLQDEGAPSSDSELQRVMDEMEYVLTPYLDPNSLAYEAFAPDVQSRGQD